MTDIDFLTVVELWLSRGDEIREQLLDERSRIKDQIEKLQAQAKAIDVAVEKTLLKVSKTVTNKTMSFGVCVGNMMVKDCGKPTPILASGRAASVCKQHASSTTLTRWQLSATAIGADTVWPPEETEAPAAEPVEPLAAVVEPAEEPVAAAPVAARKRKSKPLGGKQYSCPCCGRQKVSLNAKKCQSCIFCKSVDGTWVSSKPCPKSSADTLREVTIEQVEEAQAPAKKPYVEPSREAVNFRPKYDPF